MITEYPELCPLLPPNDVATKYEIWEAKTCKCAKQSHHSPRGKQLNKHLMNEREVNRIAGSAAYPSV
nr:hypothetical protein Itr_chr12CG25750 [Ipomoea trifida]